MEGIDWNFPFNIENLDNPIFHSKLVSVGPKHFTLPSSYKEFGVKYYNFKIRPSDVFLVGCPRSGTTWTQEAIWLLNNGLDYDTAKTKNISERVPYLDAGLLEDDYTAFGEDITEDDRRDMHKHLSSPLERLSEQASPRYIKTHIPLSLLPPTLLDTAKVVYLARDPRDAALSLYMIMKLKFLKEVDLKAFWQAYSDGKVFWTPHLEHVTEAWNLRRHPNLLFLTYEDMSNDLSSSLRRMADFFGKDYTDEQIQALCEHLSFSNFKKNQTVNHEGTFKKLGVIDDGDHAFIRKGKVGGWRENFDEELKSKAENWMTEKLADTDLPFTP